MAFVLAGYIWSAPAAPSGVGDPLELPGGWRLVIVSRADPAPIANGFVSLDPDVANSCAALSRGGTRVGYVEAEFWAGSGTQAGIGWENGEIAFGPVLTATDPREREGFEPVASIHEMAINETLRWLGVDRGDAFDEFAALSLGTFR